MASRLRTFLGIGLTFAVIAGVAAPKLLPLLDGGAKDAPEADSQAPPEALAVTAETVTPRYLAERLATTGTIRAAEQVEVVSEIAGKVVGIFFEEGFRVEKGQTLVRIDDAELAAEKERARFRLELAARRERQQRKLFEEGIVSEEEYELQLNQKNVLEAELQLIEVQLGKTEIRAPFSGVIGLRRVSAGAYLSPQTAIATLQQLDPVKIDFAVPEQYAGLVEPGREISFSIKGTEEPFEGRVYAVEPTVDPATRSLTVRAESPNPRGRLVPGAFADVELTVRAVPDALAVPAIAVIPELGGRKVFVVENGTAQPRQVETGIRTENYLEITAGLDSGDRVITSGLLQLRPGAPVEVLAQGSPPEETLAEDPAGEAP